jgi:hypothetical protein
MAISNNYISFDEVLIGEVIEIDRASRKVAVYIYKMMAGISGESSFSTRISTTTNPNISGVQYTDSLTIRNSIWARATDIKTPMPKVGSKVRILFLDDSPKNAFWLPFNISEQSYQIIDEEKYPYLFTMNLGGKDLKLNQEDRLTLKFPETLYPVISNKGKDTAVTFTEKQNYVISSQEPVRPFEGMIWYDTVNNRLKLYKEKKFNNVLFDKDLNDVYDILEQATNRILFVSKTSTITQPVENQIVGIDKSRETSGFYSYKIINDSAAWLATEKKRGIYYLPYTNMIKEYDQLIIGTVLKAFKYISGKWTEIDGWITWSGSFIGSPFASSISLTADIPSDVLWDRTTEDELKVTKIRFDADSVPSGSTVKFKFTTNDSKKIGEEFTIENTGTEFILTPSYYYNSYFDEINDVVTVPDILPSGVLIHDINCEIESDTSITFSFTNIEIEAKVRGEE